MLTGNMFAKMVGGMPDYIRKLGGKMSGGLMAQGAPQQAPEQPKFDMGLFNQSFEKPKMTLSDKIGLASGYLMDLDGSFGQGNADRFKGLYDERVGEARGAFDEKRNQALMTAAAQGDPTALAMLDPIGARNFNYNAKRDDKNDAYRDMVFNTETQRWEKSFDRGVFESDRGYNFQVDQADEDRRRFGLNYGLDARRVSAAEAKAAAETEAEAAAMQPVPGLPAPTTSITGLPAGVVGTYARSDEKALDDARKAASESRGRATLTQQFVDKADKFGAQGKGFFNDIGQALSMKTSDLEQITSKLGPSSRPEGSGSTSDKDMEIYMQSTVNINNTKGANKDVAAMESAIANRDAAYLQWLQDYTAAYPTPGASRDAKRLWDSYTYAPENSLFSVDKNGRVQVQQPEDIMSWLAKQQGAPAATDTPAPTSKQEYDALPSGAVFQAPDGSMRRKP